MTKYEYKVVVIETSINVPVDVYKTMVEDTLTPLGQEGWYVFYTNGRVYQLQRQVIA